MKYTLQEGSFSLFPAAWQDNTMGNGANLLI